MTKRALFAVAGIFVGCLTLSAQEMERAMDRPPLIALQQPGPLRPVDNGAALFTTLNSMYYGFPSLMLSDGRLFSLASAYNGIEAAPDFLPALIAADAAVAGTTSTRAADSKATAAMQPKLFDYAHGEIGVLFGTSSGRFSRQVEQGYILGEVGNDKLQISAGASYERSSGHFPRFSR
jgi:hypothetical protein